MKIISLIVLIADDDQADESIVKRPHARKVTTWQGSNRWNISSLPLSTAAAQNSRQKPRGNRDAHAKMIAKIAQSSRSDHAGLKLLNSRCVRLLIRSRLNKPLASWM